MQIKILQGPSGVGKSTLIGRLKDDNQIVYEDHIRDIDFASISETLTVYEMQTLLVASHHAIFLDIINTKQQGDVIYIDSNIEASMLMNKSLLELNELTHDQYTMLNEIRLSMYAQLFDKIKSSNKFEKVTFEFLNLYKSEEIIIEQLKQRGGPELDNPAVMKYNTLFNNPVEGLASLVYQIYDKSLVKNESKIELEYKKIVNDDDWLTIDLKELLC